VAVGEGDGWVSESESNRRTEEEEEEEELCFVEVDDASVVFTPSAGATSTTTPRAMEPSAVMQAART